METRRGRRSVWAAGAIAVAALSACGGNNGDNDGEAAFSAQLASVLETASSRYGELAERAGSVNPNQPLADEFKAQLRSTADGDRRTADEIEALTPPPAVSSVLQELAGALRARAAAFERAAGTATTTMQHLEEEGSITDAGERIDRVLRQLRRQGLLPDDQSHDEP